MHIVSFAAIGWTTHLANIRRDMLTYIMISGGYEESGAQGRS